MIALLLALRTVYKKRVEPLRTPQDVDFYANVLLYAQGKVAPALLATRKSLKSIAADDKRNSGRYKEFAAELCWQLLRDRPRDEYLRAEMLRYLGYLAQKNPTSAYFINNYVWMATHWPGTVSKDEPSKDELIDFRNRKQADRTELTRRMRVLENHPNFGRDYSMLDTMTHAQLALGDFAAAKLTSLRSQKLADRDYRLEEAEQSRNAAAKLEAAATARSQTDLYVKE
jgi:hypothetical protein